MTGADTARALLSGDLDVLATPRLVAWLEAATCAAVADAIAAGRTTVGTHVDVEHLAPSAVGSTVFATATVTVVDGRTLSFEVSATDEAGRLLCRGTLTRAVVDRARFAAAVPRPGRESTPDQ